MKLLVESGKEFIKIFDNDDPHSPQITFSASTPVPLPIGLAIAEKIIIDDYEVIEEQEVYAVNKTMKTIKLTFDTVYGSNIGNMTKLSKTVVATIYTDDKLSDYLVIAVSF